MVLVVIFRILDDDNDDNDTDGDDDGDGDDDVDNLHDNEDGESAASYDWREETGASPGYRSSNLVIYDNCDNCNT